MHIYGKLIFFLQKKSVSAQQVTYKKKGEKLNLLNEDNNTNGTVYPIQLYKMSKINNKISPKVYVPHTHCDCISPTQSH